MSKANNFIDQIKFVISVFCLWLNNIVATILRNNDKECLPKFKMWKVWKKKSEVLKQWVLKFNYINAISLQISRIFIKFYTAAITSSSKSSCKGSPINTDNQTAQLSYWALNYLAHLHGILSRNISGGRYIVITNLQTRIQLSFFIWKC